MFFKETSFQIHFYILSPAKKILSIQRARIPTRANQYSSLQRNLSPDDTLIPKIHIENRQNEKPESEPPIAKLDSEQQEKRKAAATFPIATHANIISVKGNWCLVCNTARTSRESRMSPRAMPTFALKSDGGRRWSRGSRAARRSGFPDGLSVYRFNFLPASAVHALGSCGLLLFFFFFLQTIMHFIGRALEL